MAFELHRAVWNDDVAALQRLLRAPGRCEGLREEDGEGEREGSLRGKEDGRDRRGRWVGTTTEPVGPRTTRGTRAMSAAALGSARDDGVRTGSTTAGSACPCPLPFACVRGPRLRGELVPLPFAIHGMPWPAPVTLSLCASCAFRQAGRPARAGRRGRMGQPRERAAASRHHPEPTALRARARRHWPRRPAPIVRSPLPPTRLMAHY